MTPTPVSPVPNTIRLATNERKTWVSELRSAKVGFQSGLVTGEKSIINWGIFIFALYAISWILPSSLVGFLRPLYLLNSLIFAPIAFSKAKIPIRWSFPIIFVMALQLWSFFTQAHAIAALGRIGALGRPELYLMEALVPCFVAYALVAVDPRARNPLMLMVLWAFGLSCFIAYAQFMRLGFAMRIAEAYTYKSIDNWDGAAGLRAVGLTPQPNQLAFQCIIGFGLLASRLFISKLKTTDLIGMFFFSGGVVSSQARAAYIVLFVMWIAFMIGLFRTDKKLARRIVAIGCACLVIVAGFAAKRFTYLSHSVSDQKDASVSFRENLTWSQLDTIYPRLAMTGIGPDAGLMLGTGPEDKWVEDGRIMESGYRLMIAMYGLPGLAIFVIGLVGSAASAARLLIDRYQTPERRQFAGIGLTATVFMMINCNFFNTIDGYMILPFSLMIAGLSMGIALRSPSRFTLMREHHESKAPNKTLASINTA